MPAPTTVPASAFAVGQYVSVGAIIAEVNGTPIYADDVLRAIAPLLAARAKDVDESDFRGLAANEIGRQVEEMIRNEAEFAAADRNTSAEDKQVAEKLTQQWRDKLKTDNKGSIEEVRRQFREQGRTYDEMAKEQYRTNLTRVYFHKKLVPRIQVTAADVRHYYDENRDALFTVRDNITFHLIKITPAATGSDAAARAKIEGLAEKARRGEEFATLAGRTNDDPLLLKNKGLVGPIDRGAFVLDEVESALWKLNPGDTTPVLQVNGNYYVAQLDAKKLGRVMGFEEDAVQKKIFDTLQGRQLNRLRQDMFTKLQGESVTTRNRETYTTTLAMAMQSYPTWHTSKPN